MAVLVLWLVMRILSMLVAAVASGAHPLTLLEQQVLLWPPSQPAGQWLERTFSAPLFRWDAFHYLTVATQGYQVGDGSTAFFPLYPYTARSFILLGLNPYVSLVLVSSAAALGFVLVFERLAKLDLPTETAKWATAFLLLFPISIALFIPYTEPMFLLSSALCLYMARKQRWWLAGLFGGLATLTKQPGIFLVVPLALELWAVGVDNRHFSWKTLQKWASLTLIPLALVGWVLVRNVVIEGARLDSGNLQQSIVSLFLSSSAEGVTHSRPFAWPWQVFGEAITAAIQRPDTSFHVAINMGGFLFVVLLLILTWRSLRPSYRYFSLMLLLADLFYYSFTISPTPIPSMFRHAFLAFPIFLGMPNLIKSKLTRILFSAVCIVLFVLLLYGYTVERWIV